MRDYEAEVNRVSRFPISVFPSVVHNICGEKRRRGEEISSSRAREVMPP